MLYIFENDHNNLESSVAKQPQEPVLRNKMKIKKRLDEKKEYLVLRNEVKEEYEKRQCWSLAKRRMRKGVCVTR